MNNLLKIAGSIAISQLAGLPGALVTRPERDPWYQQLDKPAFNPPNWVFPVVWPILYTLMGVSLFLVWQRGPDRGEVKRALIPFSIQWLLNSIWSPIFFKLRAPFYALGNLALLWLSIIATMRSFYRVSRSATWLLLPYALWVSFAAVLNYEIWRRNS